MQVLDLGSLGAMDVYTKKVALPVLECIDFVSVVGGVDQAPQYVVVEVAEAEGYAA